MLIYATSAYTGTEPISSFLKLADHASRHALAADPAQSDAILFIENSHYDEDAFFSCLRRHPWVRKYRERCFMYNEHDRPWCVLPGLYCSMPSRWFDPSRQAATRYLRLLNPVDTDLSDQPDILFSFVGSAHIPLRARLLKLRDSRAVMEDTSSFKAFYAQGYTASHQRYAETLRRSKFILCPRGAGASSIRLFETLRAGRVPVIIADEWVAPQGPDWARCSVRVREDRLDDLPELCAQLEPEWPQMASAARRVWATWFADEVLFDRMGDALGELLSTAQSSGKIRPTHSQHSAVGLAIALLLPPGALPAAHDLLGHLGFALTGRAG